MPFPKKPLVFLASGALAAGIAIPGAMALSSGGERPNLPAQVQRDDTAEHAVPEPAAQAPAPTPAVANIPGATGDANRSATAAEHSQADEHRATAAGEPANGRHDEGTEVEDENEAEHEHADNDDQHHDGEHHDGEHHDGEHGTADDNRGPGGTGSNRGRG
jgi:hypothetical protein